MELQGELSYRDGGKRKFLVPCSSGCKGLILGLEQLKAEVSSVLTELVQQEKAGALVGAADQSSEGEEDEADEEEEKKLSIADKNDFSKEPCAKRRKIGSFSQLPNI